MNQLVINSEKAKEVAVILFEKFNSNEGIFGHNIMPEDLLPTWNSGLTSSGIERGSYEHLMFITLVVSIDYQRNADQLWEAGRKTFEDDQTRWLFFPKKLMKKNIDEIMEAMKVHKLSKKSNKDPKIWFDVSKSFFEVYDSDPVNLIKQCNYDALEILNKKFDLRFKQLFPYFSGDKIFPLWIRMLYDNVEIKLKNIDKIPIPVDVHIARATFTTGCLTGNFEGTISKVFCQIDEAWKKTVELVNHPKLKYRLQLDEPLWHLSKYGCRFRKETLCPKKSKCPVSNFCVNRTINVSAKKIKINKSNINDKTSLSDFML